MSPSTNLNVAACFMQMLLTWFFYQLSTLPDIESKIMAEINEHIHSDDDITYDNLKKMTYLQQVIMESLRLYPSVPFNGFTALEDDILPGGYYVPRDTYVVYSAYVLHRSRDDLYPEPTKFIPDRFSAPPKPYTFMSFHGGPRQCLGMEMAYVEAKITIIILLRRMKIRLHHAANVQLRRAIILTARKGVHCTVHENEHDTQNDRKTEQEQHHHHNHQSLTHRKQYTLSTPTT